MFKERTTKITRLREKPESVESLRCKDEDLSSNSSHSHKAKRVQWDMFLILRLGSERKILGFESRHSARSRLHKISCEKRLEKRAQWLRSLVALPVEPSAITSPHIGAQLSASLVPGYLTSSSGLHWHQERHTCRQMLINIKDKVQ